MDGVDGEFSWKLRLLPGILTHHGKQRATQREEEQEEAPQDEGREARREAREKEREVARSSSWAWPMDASMQEDVIGRPGQKRGRPGQRRGGPEQMRERPAERRGKPVGSFPGARSALVLFAVLSVALTWPLAAHMTDRVPAGGNDLWQTTWNFWWWRTALLERHESPYATDLLYQPGEVRLGCHTHSEANVLLTLPLNIAAGEAVAMNAALLLGFVLAGWGGYLLIRELAGDPRAAFIGGAVLAFFPQHFEQSLEHLNLSSYWGMPFFLLALVRLVRRGGGREVVLTGAAFALTALLSWHNGLLVLPVAAAVFAVEICRAGRPAARVLSEAALAGLLALALVAPFAWPLAREMVAGDTYYLKPFVEKGIDPLFLLVPSDHHPFWGGLFRPLHDLFRTYPSAGFTCYAGAAALALAAAAFLGRSRGALLWAALFAANALLALGSPLVTLGKDTGVPLPFALYEKIPILGAVRVANRFAVPAMLALSVAAGLGARRILQGRSGGRGLALAGALLGAVVVDFLWTPYLLRELPRPAWTEAVRSLPPAIVLDIPGGHRARGAEDMYLQTLHHHPIAGGYVSCIPPSVERRVAELPLLRLIFEGRPDVRIEDLDVGAELARTLDALQAGIAVVHLDRTREALEARAALDRDAGAERLHNPERGIPAAALERIRAALRKHWGVPVHADAEAEVFRRP